MHPLIGTKGRHFNIALIAVLAGFLGACQSSPVYYVGTPAPEGAATIQPSGTVAIGERNDFFVAAKMGRGELTFADNTYPFLISGIGAGRIGISQVDATGAVYNLASIEDFTGTYSRIRTDHVDQTNGWVWMQKLDSDALIALRSTNQELGPAFDPEWVTISHK